VISALYFVSLHDSPQRRKSQTIPLGLSCGLRLTAVKRAVRKDEAGSNTFLEYWDKGI
jgi:hypothetical protein